MTPRIGNARAVLALLVLSLLAVAPAGAQAPYKYGFCNGLAGNPRVSNFTRAFTLGPASPAPPVTSYFVNHLQAKYGGLTTMENACPMYATAAEAEAERRIQLDAVRGMAWPAVELNWIPQGATALSAAVTETAAPTPAPAPAPDPASVLCREIAERPSAYIDQTVTVLAVKYMVSSTTLEDKTVMLQVYACANALGTVPDYDHLFVLAPRNSTTDPAAGNSVAQRIAGTVQSALEVPMQSGRFQVKKVMPFLTHATIRAP